MNKIKIISAFLILELIYILIRIMPSILATFDSSQLVQYVFFVFILILLLSSALGVFYEKKWAIVSFWIYILLPLIMGFSTFIVFVGGYYLVTINAIIATYLSVQWNKFNKSNAI